MELIGKEKVYMAKISIRFVDKMGNESCKTIDKGTRVKDIAPMGTRKELVIVNGRQVWEGLMRDCQMVLQQDDVVEVIVKASKCSGPHNTPCSMEQFFGKGKV